MCCTITGNRDRRVLPTQLAALGCSVLIVGLIHSTTQGETSEAEEVKITQIEASYQRPGSEGGAGTVSATSDAEKKSDPNIGKLLVPATTSVEFRANISPTRNVKLAWWYWRSTDRTWKKLKNETQSRKLKFPPGIYWIAARYGDSVRVIKVYAAKVSLSSNDLYYFCAYGEKQPDNPRPRQWKIQELRHPKTVGTLKVDGVAGERSSPKMQWEVIAGQDRINLNQFPETGMFEPSDKILNYPRYLQEVYVLATAGSAVKDDIKIKFSIPGIPGLIRRKLSVRKPKHLANSTITHELNYRGWTSVFSAQVVDSTGQFATMEGLFVTEVFLGKRPGRVRVTKGWGIPEPDLFAQINRNGIFKDYWQLEGAHAPRPQSISEVADRRLRTLVDVITQEFYVAPLKLKEKAAVVQRIKNGDRFGCRVHRHIMGRFLDHAHPLSAGELRQLNPRRREGAR